MKMNTKPVPTADDLLADLMARTPVLTEHDRRELAQAGQALQRDPAFLADYLKGLFVEDVLRALEEDGLTQSDLAVRMGKSRQYISKILNQDRRVNFTLDTLAEFSTALGRPLAMRLLAPNEAMTLLRLVSTARVIQPMPAWGVNEGKPWLTLRNEEFHTEADSANEMEGDDERARVPA